jgi:uncharacterized protein (TIGR03083 family)
MRLAGLEYDRIIALLADLTDDEWTRPTECPGWDVRAMATHLLGMAEMIETPRENVRQQLAARKRSETGVDALTALQVSEHAGMGPADIVATFRLVSARAARARARTPALIRVLPIPTPQDVGDAKETWTFGFLIDTILTRDPWMHRIDICRATGRDPLLTTDHDAVLVADVVTEWACRHRKPCTLRLAGPAGGRWTFGGGHGQELELDAVEFCRTVSGRAAGQGLLAVQVPF